MKKYIYLIHLFFTLSITSIAQTVQTVHPLDTIPFELGTDNRIYVTTYINGNDSTPLRFLVDTGATDIVINSNSSRSKGIASFNSSVSNNGANSVEVIPATDYTEKVRIGKQTVSGLKLISIPYPPEAWDGVIGLSYLKNFDVLIDYKERYMILYESGNGAEIASGKGKYEVLDFDYRLGIPVIHMNVCINETVYPVFVEIDTGSDRILDLNTPFVANNNLIGSKQPFAISTISGTTADGGKLLNVFFDYIKIGNITLPRIPGAFSTVKSGVQASEAMDGVMGNNMLQRFNQVYDFKNSKLYITINDRLYSPFYDFLIH